jgi:hypothetical protein
MIEPTRRVGVEDADDANGNALSVRGSFCDAAEEQTYRVSRADARSYRVHLSGRIEETTRTSTQSMNISILWLPSHQFSTENEEFIFITTRTLISNRRHGVRRPLQHLVLGNLLPLRSQRARNGTRIDSHDRGLSLAAQ